jgi:hypothetical protein
MKNKLKSHARKGASATNALRTFPPKANGLLEQAVCGATGQKHDSKHIAEKNLATIRARLCLAGGQTLHCADDGSYFVVTPWQQITKFDGIASLRAHADRGAR